MAYELTGKRIFVAGHRGMVGSAIVRRLTSEGCEILVAGRDSVDLRNQDSVGEWFSAHKPDAVFLSAAKVGGILANDTYPADFLYDNLMIEANVIHAAHRVGVQKLLFLGSSCIYPKHAHQPMKEDELLQGPLESTNEWYAIAKIAGIKLCQAYRKQFGSNFISAMPTNLYGPGDNYDLNASHVVPALLRKVHDAKEKNVPVVEVWGTGTPRRELMYVDDLADALIYLMKNYSEAQHINVGIGVDCTIRELVETVKSVVGYGGGLKFDTTKPDGTPRKLMAIDRLSKLGWTAQVPLSEGLSRTYAWFREHYAMDARL